MRRSFDLDHETITQLAEKEVPGCSGVNFLPYITGRRLLHIHYALLLCSQCGALSSKKCCLYRPCSPRQGKVPSSSPLFARGCRDRRGCIGTSCLCKGRVLTVGRVLPLQPVLLNISTGLCCWALDRLLAFFSRGLPPGPGQDSAEQHWAPSAALDRSRGCSSTLP